MLSKISPNIVLKCDSSVHVPPAKMSFEKVSSFDQSMKVEIDSVKESTLKRVKSSPEISLHCHGGQEYLWLLPL